MLASAEVVAGKNITWFFAIKDDLVHAGATYRDAEVVVDGNLITSRKPAGLFGRHHYRPGGRGAVPRLPEGLVARIIHQTAKNLVAQASSLCKKHSAFSGFTI